MKRIVLCFDGTWNVPADEALPMDEQVETNVSRFYRSVAASDKNGVQQDKWYNAGVGTRWYDAVAGGAFGAGLDRHIVDGYRHLVETYEAGDDVFVLWFSRGAYTARSLVGMIRNCGLVRPRFIDLQVAVAYGIYRTRDDGPDSVVARTFRAMFAQEIPIRFLGVWDTVGALGIPLHFASRLNMVYYQFHDTSLSRIVSNAYQAIALDEHREDYKICLWEDQPDSAQTVEQRWFSGSHSDVGGGYADRRLSDLALLWMQGRASAQGLALEPTAVSADNYKGSLTDSYSAFLDGYYAKFSPPYYRPVLSTSFGIEAVDSEIDQRRRDAALAYSPPNVGLPALT